MIFLQTLLIIVLINVKTNKTLLFCKFGLFIEPHVTQMAQWRIQESVNFLND